MRTKETPLWRCPGCGHRFTSKNLVHSCGRYSLAAHFQGKPKVLRGTFNRLVRVARACGPVTVYAQKSRIVLQQRVRFSGVVVRADWLDVHLWLRHEVSHPRFYRSECLGRLGFAQHFKLRYPMEIDEPLAALIRESYFDAKEGILS